MTFNPNLLFLQEAQEQFLHLQDPPQLQVPARGQSKRQDQFHPVRRWQIYATRRHIWEVISSRIQTDRHYSLFAQSQGSMVRLMLLSARGEVKRRLATSSRMSLCYGCQTEGGCFIASRGQQDRVQNAHVTLHTDPSSMIPDKRVCAHDDVSDDHPGAGAHWFPGDGSLACRVDIT